MRDQRFVAAHRGGPLQREDHILLARWAADCAESVLPLFLLRSEDERPRRALEMGRAWANGDVPTGAAMKASVAAHAAAREVNGKAATAAARAAGQSVATAHFADHSMGTLLYALKALEASGLPTAPELDARLALLPEPLRAMVSNGIHLRLTEFGIKVFDRR